ncbi:MAG: zinc ribbon domain-containing protein [Chloroflexi bacterium]|nr:zinc ribbon domain-containing protein [Chloroflexota bacterium]
MEFLVIAIMVVIVLAFIAYPLFTSPREQTSPGMRRRGPAAGTGTPDPSSSAEASADSLDALIAQRNALYDAIRDLDFDFQLGKLSQSDYQLLRDQYMARAATLLQQMDAAEARVDTNGAGAEIEQEVARLRAHQPAGEDAVEDQVARLRRSRAHGGDAIEAQVARLRGTLGGGGKRRCSKCGQSYTAGDRFCAKCGNKL